MLHPINLPDCFEHLWVIVYIQEELLDLACTEDPTDAAVLHQRFELAVVSWLWNRRQKLLDPLREFCEHTDQAEKLAVVDAFRHDITYHDHLDDPGFVFQLQPKRQMPSQLAVGVGKWLENFYDKVLEGVPAEVTGYQSDIKGQFILEEFNTINTETRVCPACDGTWMRPTSTGRLGSIDHFLPRSKYPALSVHPFNLIPICATCNEKIKKDKDPLSDNQPRTIVDAFLFYPACRPPRPGRDELTLRAAPNTSHPWVLHCQGATLTQLSLYPDIFDVPGQWQASGDEIDRLVRRRLKAKMQTVSATWGTVSRNHLDAMLYDLERRMRREWGEGAYLYPATWWLSWLHQNKFDELASEFCSH